MDLFSCAGCSMSISFCMKYIESYKASNSVQFADFRPKNPQGNILKKKIPSKFRKPSASDLGSSTFPKIAEGSEVKFLNFYFVREDKR